MHRPIAAAPHLLPVVHVFSVARLRREVADRGGQHPGGRHRVGDRGTGCGHAADAAPRRHRARRHQGRGRGRQALRVPWRATRAAAAAAAAVSDNGTSLSGGDRRRGGQLRASTLTGTGAGNVQEGAGGGSRSADGARRGVAAGEVGVVVQRRVEGVPLVDDERRSFDRPPEAIAMGGRRRSHDGDKSTGEEQSVRRRSPHHCTGRIPEGIRRVEGEEEVLQRQGMAGESAGKSGGGMRLREMSAREAGDTRICTRHCIRRASRRAPARHGRRGERAKNSHIPAHAHALTESPLVRRARVAAVLAKKQRTGARAVFTGRTPTYVQ